MSAVWSVRSTTVSGVDLTESYKLHVPDHVLAKYSWLEVRNATGVLKASNPDLFDEIIEVLDDFYVTEYDIVTPGGNRGPIPIKLDGAFAELGWLPVRINTKFSLLGKVKGGKKSGQKVIESSVESAGFEVDNFKGRVALDVEWNAKDGNLDRDLSAYRALYDVGLIDCAVLITRDLYSILDLARNDLGDEDAVRRLKGTTTTNTYALEPKLTRGDGAGCPVLAVGISRETWDGQ